MPYIKALGFVFLAALSTSVIAADRELLVSGFPDYPDIKVTHGQDFVDAHPILSQQMGRNGEGYLIDAGVADWSPEKWASLVPEQVPDIRSACPNNPTSGVWLFDPDFPDQMTCDGLVFPDNPAYPEQSEVMLTPWGTETTIRFHQDVDGKRYYLRGQLDVERFEFLDKKPKDLARAWHQNKDTDPIKAAKYAASVEAILLEYARVFPTYLPVLKNSHYYDTGGSHLADGEIVPANKPAFPAGGSLWIRWPSNASLPYELADVYDIAYASPGMDKIVPGETKTLREMFEDNVLDTAVNYVLAFEWRYHISGNISSHFSGMVRFARIMGRPDYARFVYDAINYAQTLYENGWDQVATQGLGYHRLWMDNPTGAAYALNYYSDPAGYLDEQGERFDFLDLRTPINMQRMRLNWSALILPNGYDTPVHDGVNDANRPLYNARVNHSETRILAAFGEAALSDGVDTQQVEAHLHWSGGNNHAHQDMLNIYLFGHGRELFGDLLESPTHSTV